MKLHLPVFPDWLEGQCFPLRHGWRRSPKGTLTQLASDTRPPLGKS